MANKAGQACLVLFCSILVSPLVLMNAHAAGCTVTCQLTANTNIPSSEGTVWVLVDNTNYTRLPNTFSFPKGTTHTIKVLNQTLNTPNGARYAWKQWSFVAAGSLYTTSITLNTPPVVVNYTAGQNGEFTAEFQKQFVLTLSFSDPTGQPVAQPSSVTLRSGATTIVDTAYSGQWLASKVWIVTNATWQGSPNTESGTASFNLSAGPVSGTLVLRAYTAIIEVVDRSNSPLAGATVIATLANQTVKVSNTDDQGKVHLGHIPLGPYSIQIKYQGQDMGTWTSDASTSPTLTAKLDVTGPTLTNPLALVRDHWQLAAIGFFAGFVCMGITVRLTGRKPYSIETNKGSSTK